MAVRSRDGEKEAWREQRSSGGRAQEVQRRKPSPVNTESSTSSEVVLAMVVVRYEIPQEEQVGADEWRSGEEHSVSQPQCSTNAARTVSALLTRGLLWHASAPSAATTALSRATPIRTPHAATFINPLAASSAPIPPRRCVAFDIPALDSQIRGGLGRAAVHEWCVTEESYAPPSTVTTYLACRALLCSLARHAIAREGWGAPSVDEIPHLIWIGRAQWPTPHLLAQLLQQLLPAEYDIEPCLARCVFVDPPTRALQLWALDSALRSPAVAAVIAETPKLAPSSWRRLALAARQGGTFGICVRPAIERDQPLMTASRWQVRPCSSPTFAPRFTLELLRYKGSAPQRRSWQLEAQHGVLRLCEDLSQGAAVVDTQIPFASSHSTVHHAA